jgi:hypothetical protein
MLTEWRDPSRVLAWELSGSRLVCFGPLDDLGLCETRQSSLVSLAAMKTQHFSKR